MIALAEEERDTCPSCGLPKAFCRTPDGEVGVARFDVAEERCWATYRLQLRREALEKEKAGGRQGIQMYARFRDGKAPDIDAGLDLERLDDDQAAG